MMGIYVNGIEMPKEPDEMIELAIFGDGRTVKTGESWRSPVDGKCYYGPSEDMNTYSAFAVPPHGRLIDADALVEDLKRQCEEVFKIDAVSPEDFWITRDEAYNERLWKTWCESFFDYLNTREIVIQKEEGE